MRWYRSKIDWWIAALLCVPLVTFSIALVGLIQTGKSAGWPYVAGGALFVAALYGGLVFPMRYGLDDTVLIVRFGLCRRRIALADIIEVYPTNNPLSSPALSLDRLHIRFGDGLFKSVMISPNDREQFLADLAQNAGLQRDGDRLQRSL